MMLCLPKKSHNAPHVGVHSQSCQVSEIDYTKQISLLPYIWNRPTPLLTRLWSTHETRVSPFRMKGYFPKKLWCRIGRKMKHQHFASHNRSTQFYDLSAGSQRQLFQPCSALAPWRRNGPSINHHLPSNSRYSQSTTYTLFQNGGQ